MILKVRKIHYPLQKKQDHEDKRHVLSRRTEEAQVLKVAFGLFSRSLEEHAAIIDDEDLVDEPIDRLASLVQAYESGAAANVSPDAQRLDETQGRAGIETTGRVVPANDGRARC